MYIFYHINNTRTEVHNFQNFQNYSSGEKIYFPATELLEQLNIELRKPMAFSQKKKEQFSAQSFNVSSIQLFYLKINS